MSWLIRFLSTLRTTLRMYFWGILILLGIVLFMIFYSALPIFIWGILAIQGIVVFIALKRILSALDEVQTDHSDIDLAEDIFRQEPIINEQNQSEGYSTDLMKKLLNIVREDGLLALQIESIHRIGSSGAAIDIRQLGEIIVPELADRLRTFRVLASSTLLLGLFGTVIGLSVTVWKIQPLFIGGTPLNEVYEAMGRSFGGMQTAFVTTIVGIISSLILNIFPGRLYSKELNAWKRRINRITLFELIPRLSSGPSTRAIERATKNLGEMAGTVKDSVQTLALQTQRIAGEMSNLLSFISVFDTGSQRIARSLDILSRHYDNMQLIFNKIEGSIEKVNTLIESNIDSVRTYHSDLTDYQKSVGTVVDRVANLLSDLKGDRIEFANMVSSYVSTLEDTMKFINASDIKLRDRYKGLIDALDEIGINLSTRLSQILEHIDEILHEHKKISADLQQSFVDQAIEQLRIMINGGLEVHRQVTHALVQAGFRGGDGRSKETEDK